MDGLEVHDLGVGVVNLELDGVGELADEAGLQGVVVRGERGGADVERGEVGVGAFVADGLVLRSGGQEGGGGVERVDARAEDG